MITLPARGERHASVRPTVLSCRHSREVTRHDSSWLTGIKATRYLTDPPPAISFTKTGPVAILDSCLFFLFVCLFVSLPSWVWALVQLHRLHRWYLHHWVKFCWGSEPVNHQLVEKSSQIHWFWLDFYHFFSVEWVYCLVRRMAIDWCHNLGE